MTIALRDQASSSSLPVLKFVTTKEFYYTGQLIVSTKFYLNV